MDAAPDPLGEKESGAERGLSEEARGDPGRVCYRVRGPGTALRAINSWPSYFLMKVTTDTSAGQAGRGGRGSAGASQSSVLDSSHYLIDLLSNSGILSLKNQ